MTLEETWNAYTNYQTPTDFLTAGTVGPLPPREDWPAIVHEYVADLPRMMDTDPDLLDGIAADLLAYLNATAGAEVASWAGPGRYADDTEGAVDVDDEGRVSVADADDDNEPF